MSSITLSCPHCGTTNRLPAERLEQSPACGRCRKALFTAAPIVGRGEQFAKLLKNTDIPVIVDFWAGWCGPCRMMAPTFAELTKRMEPHYRFVKVDTEAEPALAARYHIRSLPTLIRFEKGQEVKRISGALSLTQLEQWIRT